MSGDWPDPDRGYHDKDYPDPDEAAELNKLAEESSASGGFRIPGLLKIVAALAAVGILGSIIFATVGPLARGGGRSHDSSSTQTYPLWIGTQVKEALTESGTAETSRFLGVQFPESTQHPVVGIQTDRIDTRNPLAGAALRRASVAILRRLFADERASMVTVAWLQPVAANGASQPAQEVILVVEMTRQTADGVDWTTLGAEGLRDAADLYQEVRPSAELPGASLPSRGDLGDT